VPASCVFGGRLLAGEGYARLFCRARLSERGPQTMINIHIDRLKTIVPYAGPFLIFLGVLKLTIYYRAFNVQIMSFLDLSEVLTAFLDDLLLLTLAIGSVILFDLATTTKSELDSSRVLHDTFSFEPNFFKRLRIYLKRMAGFLVPINLVLILAVILQLFRPNPDFYYLIWTLLTPDILALCMLLLLEYKRRHYVLYKKPLDPSSYNLTLFLVVILVMLIFKAESDIHSVKVGKKYLNSSFVLDSLTINSDSLHYYIGNTKDYLFFFDEQKNQSVVLPMNRIKRLTFKE
jgi:hypothetical protein